jgi:hypothetical protein
LMMVVVVVVVPGVTTHEKQCGRIQRGTFINSDRSNVTKIINVYTYRMIITHERYINFSLVLKFVNVSL